MLYIAPVVAKCKRAQQSMYLSQLTSPSFSITMPVHGKNGMGESNVGGGLNAQPSRKIRTNNPHDLWLADVAQRRKGDHKEEIRNKTAALFSCILSV
jgi:hypothetical protein